MLPLMLGDQLPLLSSIFSAFVSAGDGFRSRTSYGSRGLGSIIIGIEMKWVLFQSLSQRHQLTPLLGTLQLKDQLVKMQLGQLDL